MHWAACGAAPWEARYCHRVALLDDLLIMTGGHGARGENVGPVDLKGKPWLHDGLIMVDRGLRMIHSGL